MSYRSYRLKRTVDARSLHETTEIRVHIKNLKLTMEKYAFNEVHSILMFDCLNSFVNKAETLNMSEAQVFASLQTFLPTRRNHNFVPTLAAVLAVGVLPAGLKRHNICCVRT